MGIFDKLAKRYGYTKIAGQPVAPIWGATAEAQRYSIPDGSVYETQTALMHKLSWVYTAVLKTAQIGASARLSVKRRAGEDLRDVPNHPLELLLDRPNPLQSRSEFMTASMAYRKLSGNCYWWLNRTSDSAEPSEIWVIPPNRIQPVPDGNSFIAGYAYDPGNGQMIHLEAWEIIHFKNFHPINPFVGMSAIESLSVVAGADIEAQKWNARYFGENNARLPGIIAFSDNIADGPWDDIKREVRDASKRRNMMMLRNVGQGGVNWLQNAVSQRDMEYLAGRTFAKEEVFTVLAPGLASMLSVNATEANAKTGKATLIELEVWPMLVDIADKITNDLLPVYGEGLRAEFDDIRVSDRALKLQEIDVYSRTHTLAEIRKEHYGDDPLGDERDSLLPSQITGATAPEPVEPELAQEETEAPELPEAETEPEDEGLENTEPDETADELEKWERMVTKRVKSGKTVREFESDIIPPGLAGAIAGQLEGCQTVEQVKAVFAAAAEWRNYP